ncbi:spore germination protein GerPC [Bacillus fonticola]|uniref:spore germination protein GerPC n=1 Tax=Bacillus fonticola TaxID=2728853 RepID=UPI0014742CE3|nr:spore germination protein GerPC [Bacillus fonticola]
MNPHQPPYTWKVQVPGQSGSPVQPSKTATPQSSRLDLLEKEVRELRQLVQKLQDQPAIRVDRIEYKFDQLKVENLDGTLHIGLSPTDLENMEDLVPGNAPQATPYTDPKGWGVTKELENEMLHYLENDYHKAVERACEQLGIPVNPMYADFMKDDIRKQLPTRLQYHLQRMPQALRTDPNTTNLKKEVSLLMKQDIYQGIMTFLTQANATQSETPQPNQTTEEKANGEEEEDK